MMLQRTTVVGILVLAGSMLLPTATMAASDDDVHEPNVYEDYDPNKNDWELKELLGENHLLPEGDWDAHRNQDENVPWGDKIAEAAEMVRGRPEKATGKDNKESYQISIHRRFKARASVKRATVAVALYARSILSAIGLELIPIKMKVVKNEFISESLWGGRSRGRTTDGKYTRVRAYAQRIRDEKDVIKVKVVVHDIKVGQDPELGLGFGHVPMREYEQGRPSKQAEHVFFLSRGVGDLIGRTAQTWSPHRGPIKNPTFRPITKETPYGKRKGF